MRKPEDLETMKIMRQIRRMVAGAAHLIACRVCSGCA